MPQVVFRLVQLGFGDAFALEGFAHSRGIRFGELLGGRCFGQLGLDLLQSGFGGFYVGFGLGDGAGVEQLGVARFDHREERFAGFDFIAGVEADPQDAAGERGGDDVVFADACFAVFIDRDVNVAAIDLDEVDLDRRGRKA